MVLLLVVLHRIVLLLVVLHWMVLLLVVLHQMVLLLRVGLAMGISSWLFQRPV